MTNDTTPAPIGADAALARLVAAVEAETGPDWDCNSYHPSLWSALDVARAALAAAAQPAPIGADALAELHALADRIEETRGHPMNIDPRCAAILRAALAAAAQPANLSCPSVQKRLATQWGYVHVSAAPAAAPKAAPAPAAVAEPVAWLHDDPQRYDVIHAAVKDLLVQYRDAAGHLHRPLDKSAHYTIPLYAAPTPSAQGDASPTMPKDIEMMATNRYRPVPSGVLAYKVVGGDGNRSLFSGTKDECQIVARKLTEAFLDGAHVALSTHPAAQSAQGDALDAACQRACKELPEGMSLAIQLERDAGWVELHGSYGGQIDLPDPGDSLSSQLHQAIDAARAAEEGENHDQ